MASTEEIRNTLRDFIAAQEASNVLKQTSSIPAEKTPVTKSNKKEKTTTTSSTAPPNLPRASDIEKTSIAKLPTELLQQCISYMDVREIIKFRRTSRKHADLCQSELFKTGFSLRPHRNDMVRLAKACLVPGVAKGIKEMTVYMGDMNMDQFLAGIDQAGFSIDPNKHLIAIKRLFEKESVHCQQDILEAIFSQLPNLTSIKLTSFSSPFWQDYDDMKLNTNKEKTRMHFEAMWALMGQDMDNFDRTHFLDSERSVQRYTSVLLASLKLPSTLRTLEMDAFPIDCFSRDMSHLTAYDSEVLPADVALNQKNFDQIKRAVSNLQGVDIGLIGSGDPTTLYSGANLGKALGKFIGAMKHVKSLSVKWMLDEDANEEFTTGWDKTMFGLHFEHLQDLRLVNMDTSRDIVSEFILRHKETLKRLHWTIPYYDDTDFFTGSEDGEPRTWRLVFTDFKEQIKNLECCELAEDDPHFRDPDLYSKDWKPQHINSLRKVTAPYLLEMYVKGKLPWPMKKDNPHRYRGWQPKHTSTYADFALYTPAELADLFSEEWETDREDSDSSMGDDDISDDSDDDDSDGSDEGEYTMDFEQDGDEWEDEEDDIDEHFFDDLPNLIADNGMVWGNIPPEMLMAALAANGFQQDVDMNMDANMDEE